MGLVYPGIADTLDVSHWQGNINFPLLYEQGVRNIWVKCTNGSHGLDNRYYHNVEAGREVGMRVGSYHFMLSTQDPDEQAANFIKHYVTGRSGDILPMADFEW